MEPPPSKASEKSQKPLLETPQGRAQTSSTGIGLYTNGINPRAVGLNGWQAKISMLDDVRFLLAAMATVDPDATPEARRKVWEQIYKQHAHPPIPISTARWGRPSIQASGSPTAVAEHSSTSGRAQHFCPGRPLHFKHFPTPSGRIYELLQRTTTSAPK